MREEGILQETEKKICKNGGCARVAVGRSFTVHTVWIGPLSD